MAIDVATWVREHTRGWMAHSVCIAIEEPFNTHGIHGAMLQHGVFSAIVYDLTSDFRVIPVWPTTIKRFVGGPKKKLFIVREVYRRWGFSADDDNVVDAYAIARWAASERGVKP